MMKRVKRRKVWIPIYYVEKFLETMDTFDEVNDLHIIEYFHERWILIGFTFINTPKDAIFNENLDYIFRHQETWLTPDKIAKYSFDISKEYDLIHAIDSHGKEYAYYMPGTILKMYPERRIDDNHFNEQFYFHQGLSDIYESYLESKGVY